MTRYPDIVYCFCDWCCSQRMGDINLGVGLYQTMRSHRTEFSNFFSVCLVHIHQVPNAWQTSINLIGRLEDSNLGLTSKSQNFIDWCITEKYNTQILGFCLESLILLMGTRKDWFFTENQNCYIIFSFLLSDFLSLIINLIRDSFPMWYHSIFGQN